MKAVFAPTPRIQPFTALAANSGPLSERTWPGVAAQDEQVGQHVDDVGHLELATHPDGQVLAGEFIHVRRTSWFDDVQHAELAPVPRPALHTVIGPDVVRPLRPQPNAGAVVQPKLPAPGMPGRDLQPLAPPDALHPLVVAGPALGPEQRHDPPGARPVVLAGQADDALRQRLLVRSARKLALRRAVLPQYRTGGRAKGIVVEQTRLRRSAGQQPVCRVRVDEAGTVGDEVGLAGTVACRAVFPSLLGAGAARRRPLGASISSSRLASILLCSLAYNLGLVQCSTRQQGGGFTCRRSAHRV
jgi:hypothetical protein